MFHRHLCRQNEFFFKQFTLLYGFICCMHFLAHLFEFGAEVLARRPSGDEMFCRRYVFALKNYSAEEKEFVCSVGDRSYC